MDWADELAASVSGPQVVNDSKTPSGTVHVGSLRGPVINDVIVRAMRAAGMEATYLYGVDDLDPMDAQALLTPDAVEHEMGRPLAHVPDQAGDGHASYARHHAQVFIDTFAGLGIRPDRYYWMSEIYESGAVDPYIRLALDRADRVRDIYRRVANVEHPADCVVRVRGRSVHGGDEPAERRSEIRTAGRFRGGRGRLAGWREWEGWGANGQQGHGTHLASSRAR
jgi:lysyl-tRNA synthetase class 1